MLTSTTDDEELMGLLGRAVHESMQILNSTGEPCDIWTKKSFDDKVEVVTSKDLKIEQCFREHLLTRYPHAAIISEEAGFDADALSAPLCFVLDPIDGTQQYVNGSPHFAISVAAITKGQVSHGVVAYPSSDVILVAMRGRGATISDKILPASRTEACPGPIRLGVSPSELNTQQLAELCSHMIDVEISVIPTFTGKGGAVARQILDVALHFSIFSVAYIWDYAAIALVLEETGHACTDITGRGLTRSLPLAHRGGWIAGAPALLSRFYPAIRRIRNKHQIDRDL